MSRMVCWLIESETLDDGCLSERNLGLHALRARSVPWWLEFWWKTSRCRPPVGSGSVGEIGLRCWVLRLVRLGENSDFRHFVALQPLSLDAAYWRFLMQGPFQLGTVRDVGFAGRVRSGCVGWLAWFLEIIWRWWSGCLTPSSLTPQDQGPFPLRPGLSCGSAFWFDTSYPTLSSAWDSCLRSCLGFSPSSPGCADCLPDACLLMVRLSTLLMGPL